MFFNEQIKTHFIPRENRTVTPTTLVGVHWNSHKHVWSIVEMKSRRTVGKVLGYADEVTLRDVTFHIDRAKQKSVLERGVKDRHAFIVGYIENFRYEPLNDIAYYNPYKVSRFVSGKAFLEEGRVEILDRVSRLSMTYNLKEGHPVTTYENLYY